MASKKRLLNLLQVRENEWWLVRQLFFQQFFSGVGIAFFITASFLLFLKHFSITALPEVFIASAFMQWMSAYLFSKAEHKFPVKKLILIINLFIAASIFLFRIAAGYTDSIVFFFCMLVWSNALYLLSSLDFWGLAALLFDVRQSKRLFGIISAGDIPAKFIGYSTAFIIGPIIGTNNLLIIAGIAVLYSLVYWQRLKKSGHLEMSHQHHHVEHKAKGKEESFTGAVIRFFENKLVLNLAILSFLVCSISWLFYFVFYSKITSAALNDHLLAGYIALFMGLSRGIAIVMKLFFTNRITSSLGIRGSLLISPVVLLIMLVPVFFMPIHNEGAKAALFIFGLVSITNDVLRSAILTPVFLSIMQPLRAQVRLRAHNIVKGVMDPFGLLFIGLLLYFMLAIQDQVDLYFLSYVLTGLLVISIAWIFIVDSEYAKMLVVALRNRYFNSSEIVIDNKESLNFFIHKSVNGETADVIFMLNLIGRNSNEHIFKIIDNAMQHPDDRVKIEAIKTIERLHLVNNLDRMKMIAAKTNHPELLHESVKAIYTLIQGKEYNDYLDEKNIKLMSAAVTGMLRNENQMQRGIEYLKMLASSPDKEKRIYASAIIAESARHTLIDEMIILMNDKDYDVSKAAIKISGKLNHNEIAKALLNCFTANTHEKIILNALIENGHHSVAPLKEFIDKNKLPAEKRVKLIDAIGKIGGTHSKKILNEMIEHDSECRNDILSGLHLSHFKAEKPDENKYRSMIIQLLDEAAQLVLHTKLLTDSKNYPLLKRALELELNIKREIILNAFTFFYDSEKIQHARTVFSVNKKENIANALEIIDVTVQKDFAQKFIVLFDAISNDMKAIEIIKHFNIKSLPVDELIKQILMPQSYYNQWTKACVLYEMDNMSVEKFKTIIMDMAAGDNLLIKETAVYILDKQNL